MTTKVTLKVEDEELKVTCIKDLSFIKATCREPGCNGRDNCVAGKCKHKMVSVHKNWLYSGTLLARCLECSVEAAIEIPSYIAESQKWKYVVHVIEKINKGEIKI